jgi:polyisoprenoid-binding protein YceI
MSSLIRPVFILIVAGLVAGCAAPQAAPPTSVPATVAPSPTDKPAMSTLTPTAAPVASPTPSAAPPAAAGAVIRFVLVPEKSEARYRVNEQLAGANLPNDAIGRTKDFTGTLVIQADGALAPGSSQFVVKLGTLASDQSLRDNYLRGNVLQTSQYPNAIFAPTQVSGLPFPLPQSGAVTFKLTGDLTVRNVTKPVIWNVTAQVQGDQVTGQATTAFTFGEFSLTQPRVGRVLSIEDKIALELDVTLQRARP